MNIITPGTNKQTYTHTHTHTHTYEHIPPQSNTVVRAKMAAYKCFCFLDHKRKEQRMNRQKTRKGKQRE